MFVWETFNVVLFLDIYASKMTSRRPSREDADQDLKWFHGKITRPEAEALLQTGSFSYNSFNY